MYWVKQSLDIHLSELQEMRMMLSELSRRSNRCRLLSAGVSLICNKQVVGIAVAGNPGEGRRGETELDLDQVPSTS